MERKREKHGMTRTREYRIWRNMLNRCYFEMSTEYKSHGGRGIIVCEEWKNSFINFFNDMGFSNNLSLDRIDNNGNYTKENCRWATPKQQSLNRRSNVYLEFKGINQTIKEWSDELGLKRGTIPKRISLGWSVDKIITTPSRIKPK